MPKTYLNKDRWELIGDFINSISMNKVHRMVHHLYYVWYAERSDLYQMLLYEAHSAASSSSQQGILTFLKPPGLHTTTEAHVFSFHQADILIGTEKMSTYRQSILSTTGCHQADTQKDLWLCPGHHAVCDQHPQWVGKVSHYHGCCCRVRGLLPTPGTRPHCALSLGQNSCPTDFLFGYQLLSKLLYLMAGGSHPRVGGSGHGLSDGYPSRAALVGCCFHQAFSCHVWPLHGCTARHSPCVQPARQDVAALIKAAPSPMRPCMVTCPMTAWSHQYAKRVTRGAGVSKCCLTHESLAQIYLI